MVLQEAEQATEAGLTAIGYVSFEAAAAFDPGLVGCNSDQPLAIFGLYDRIKPVQWPITQPQAMTLQPAVSRSSYLQRVSAVKAYLATGDSYQVNLTHQFQGRWQESVEALFARLVAAQPTPYAACLDWQDGAICSVSPELFFSLNQDQLSTEPMKGTRSRVRTRQRMQCRLPAWLILRKIKQKT